MSRRRLGGDEAVFFGPTGPSVDTQVTTVRAKGFAARLSPMLGRQFARPPTDSQAAFLPYKLECRDYVLERWQGAGSVSFGATDLPTDRAANPPGCP